MGSGLGSVSNKRILHCIGELLAATVPAGLQIATQALPLSEIEAGWADTASTRRIVFRPG